MIKHSDIVNAWNQQADEYNQWDNLGEDEKVEWAAYWQFSLIAKWLAAISPEVHEMYLREFQPTSKT